MDYFGQPCHPIVICFVKVVNGAKGRGTFHKKFKYHKIQYLFVKFLTYGGLILWAHFPSHLVTFIFCSRLTMSLNGLRTKPQDRMIPKRLLTFFKSNVFLRFGVPRALISDRGTHFCNKMMETLLRKYNVTHRVSIAYHPQTNG